MSEIAEEILSGYRDGETGAVIDEREPGHIRALQDRYRSAGKARSNKARTARRKRAKARKRENQT